MHVDVNRLKGKTVEMGMNGEKLAKLLEIDQSTYYRKLGADGTTFTLDQVFRITEALKLSRQEAVDIFLAQ